MDDTILLKKYGPRKPSLIGLIVTVLLVSLVFFYATIAIFSKDVLWFWPRFEAQPAQIIVHCFGEDITLAHDSPHLADISRLVNDQLSGDKRWTDLPLSDLDYYRTNRLAMALEMKYSEPVRIHYSNFFFTGLDTLIIPLAGRHANLQPVFGLREDIRAGGALHVQTFEPLVEYLAQNELCRKP